MLGLVLAEENTTMRQISADRILTTHVGSLPRPPALVELLRRRERGEPYDVGAFEETLARAIVDVAQRQVAAGLDIVNDGEFSKPSYSTYIQERLAGFGEVPESLWRAERHREHDAFPEYYAKSLAARGPDTRRKLGCVGPVTLRDREPMRRDVRNLRQAIDAAKPVGAFMTAASPGVIARFHPDAHYRSGAAYRQAVGEAMQAEYEAIAAAGFIIQVDCPDLASGRNTVFASLTDEQFLRESEISIEILNHALRNVPQEQVRLHLCWGNYEGPHIHDIALEKILPVVLKAKAQVISFEGANPRHEHEWDVWKRIKLPDDRAVMPGIIDSLTNFVEHPELVAQRICRYADVVGRDRVIAAVDCGFETFIGTGRIDPMIVYAKLEALAEGARIASKRLW
jgi:5-methyltetrahydropteroyltriglutamate--homocysteine methyltransferase